MTLLCGSLYAHRSTHLKKAIFLFRLCHLTVAIISYLRPKRKADEKFPPSDVERREELAHVIARLAHDLDDRLHHLRLAHDVLHDAAAQLTVVGVEVVL